MSESIKINDIESQSLMKEFSVKEEENSFKFWVHGSDRTCCQKVGDLLVMVIQGIAALLCFFSPLIAYGIYVLIMWVFFHYAVFQ